MVDRYRFWLGAGVLAGGVSAAMLAGAGVAAADDAAPTGASAASGSDDADNAGPDTGPSVTMKTSQESRAAEDDAAEDDAVEDDAAEDDAAEGTGKHRRKSRDSDQQTGAPSSEDVAIASPLLGDTDGSERTAPEGDASPPAGDAPASVEEPDEAPQDVQAHSSFVSSIDTDLSSSDGATVMQLAAASAVWPDSDAPSIFDALNDVFTSVYNSYTGAMQFIAGPARAPFGSPVRVEGSDLTVGTGVVVPVDWYFPPGSAPATGLIYLQHGMLATSRFYSATAAYLAEKTHSIVVAPTLTWNPFDTANHPLMLPSTHRAIADLFTGDRAALAASAQEAGFRGTLPTRVVLAGHSAGGGLVIGTARYMVRNGAAGNLAGVVMLDGAGIGGIMDLDLARIPESIPVYNLGAAPSSWNNNGHAARRLAQARPDAFTGMLVQGGLHSDSMQSSSAAVQLMAYLATGFSSPLNIVANQLLSAGWINDMLNGTHTARFYSSSASPVSVVTRALLNPAPGVRALGRPSQAAGASAQCPADPVAPTHCADPSHADSAWRERERVATRPG